MPRIPIENDRGPTNLGLVPQSPSRAAAGEAAGIRVGEAARELGETITSVGASVTREAVQEKQRKDFVDAQTLLLDGINSIRDEVESGEQFEFLEGDAQGVAPLDRPAAFRERFEDLFSKTAGELDDRTQVALRARLMPFVVGQTTKIAEQAEVDQQAIAYRDLPAQQNAIRRSFVEAENAEGENAAENAWIELHEGLPGLTEAQMTEFVNRGFHDMQIDKARSLEHSDLIELSEQGKFQQAFPRVSPEEERVLVEQARVKRERGQEITNDRKLEAGTLTVREIDQQLDDGIIGPANGRRYKKAIQSSVLSGSTDALADQMLMDVMVNNGIPNPYAKVGGVNLRDRAVNRGYARLSGARDEMGEEVFWNQVGNLSAKMQKVPDLAKGELRATMQAGLRDTGDGTQAVLAGHAIQNIISKNPMLAGDFQDDDVLLSHDYNTAFVALGRQNEQAAADQVRSIYTQSDADRKVRRERMEADLRVEPNAEWLDDNVDTPFLGAPDTIPVGMQAEFNSISSSNYMLNGDMEKARTAALQVIDSRWKIDDINGKPEWRRISPFTLFPEDSDEGHGWMQKDLHREVLAVKERIDTLVATEQGPPLPADISAREGIRQLTDFPDNFDTSMIRIDTDIFTERGERRDYAVHLVTSGGFVPLRDETGELVFFEPNPLTSQTLAESRERRLAENQAFVRGESMGGAAAHLATNFMQVLEESRLGTSGSQQRELLSKINENIVKPLVQSATESDFLQFMAQGPAPPDTTRDATDASSLALGPVIFPIFQIAKHFSRLGAVDAPSQSPVIPDDKATRQQVVADTLATIPASNAEALAEAGEVP